MVHLLTSLIKVKIGVIFVDVLDSKNSFLERISPLAVSVFKYHDDVAQLLFNHGADPNLSGRFSKKIILR